VCRGREVMESIGWDDGTLTFAGIACVLCGAEDQWEPKAGLLEREWGVR